ncbi:MAG: GAF domain-containing protein [candidate division NC10 bacterium]|nr:GAF domain-containing protein [candidate division NC10 bacterium]
MEPEINCRLTRSILTYLERQKDGQTAQRFLEALGVPAALLTDENNWVSYDFYRKALRTACQVLNDPDAPFKIGQHAISKESIGAAHVLIRSLGTPLGVYRRGRDVYSRFSKVSDITIRNPQPGSLTVINRMRPGFPPDPLVCRVRAGMYAAVPGIFRIPAAAVREEACQSQGASVCVYRVEWNEGATGRFAFWGSALGAAGGLFLFLVLHVRAPEQSLVLKGSLALFPLLLGFTMGRLQDLNRNLTVNYDVVVDLHREIEDAMKLLEQKYGELRSAHQELEASYRTIDRRASELSTLFKASVALGATLDLNRLIETVLHLAVDELGYDRAMVLLYDAERHVLTRGRVLGASPEVVRRVEGLEIAVDREGGAHATVVATGEPVLVEDVQEAGVPVNRAIVDALDTRGFLVVPLKAQDRIVGTLAVDNLRSERRLTKEDQRLLMTLGTPVALAIANAASFRIIEELNLTLEEKVRRRTEELEASFAKLQELDRLKSEFLSNVSHELRTPLNAIKGSIDNLLDGAAGPVAGEQRTGLTRAKASADRLARLVNDLLDLARIEAGKVELHRRAVRLREAVSEALDAARPLGEDRRLRLEFLPSAEDLVVSADRDRLHQVLMNLLSNAIKFSPPGGRVRVEVAREGPGFIRTDVSDEGEGIPEAEQERIFEKFHQVAPGPGGKRTGSGLGLAIARSLIELQAGKIWVRSAPGRGSTFSFTLPAMPGA